MLAIKEWAKVKNHQVTLTLPDSFDENEEVEVIVLSRKNAGELQWDFWNDDELAHIGRLGLHSQSFAEDDEDYSTW
ncbi:MAG: hypothetical protein WAW36_19830 [Methylovulum miyakonense]|uniref:hypothetical protein n=1 Tax=Methylovulum miyakonense TaxID=645578 RepID=UPI003BB7D912